MIIIQEENRKGELGVHFNYMSKPKKHEHFNPLSCPCLARVHFTNAGDTLACVSSLCWEDFFIYVKKKSFDFKDFDGYFIFRT